MRSLHWTLGSRFGTVRWSLSKLIYFSTSSEWLLQLEEVEDPMKQMVFEIQLMEISNTLFDDDFSFQPDNQLPFCANHTPSFSNFNSTHENISKNINYNQFNNHKNNKNVPWASSISGYSWMDPKRPSKMTGFLSEMGERVISFGGSESEDLVSHGPPQGHNIQYVERDLGSTYGSFQYSDPHKSAGVKLAKRAAQDHVLSERRRREKLAEKFLGLTAVLPHPGSKMTKASTIEEAMKHIKQLEKQIKFLDEQQTRQKDVSGSTDPQGFVDQIHTNSCSSDNYYKTSPLDQLRHPFIEILATSKGTSVLIRAIVSTNDNDFNPVTKILGQIAKLKLTPIQNHAMPFGSSRLIITVTCQMDDDFQMTLKDVVKQL